MKRLKTRPYQQRIIWGVHKLFASGHRRVLVQLATGAGKTHIATSLIEKAASRRVVFVVPTTEILEQTSEKLTKMKLKHETLSAGKKFSMHRVSILVAMSHTLTRRVKSTAMFDTWSPDLIFVDEAHKLIEQHRTLLEKWPRCPAIALSATPIRLDGKSLGALWPDLICGPSIKRLISDRFLVPPVTYQAPMPDLSRVRIRRGEFDQAQLERVYSEDRIINAVPEAWLKHAKGRPTITFTTGVAASKLLVAAYKRRGIRAMHVDGNTPSVERERALRQLRQHTIDVLCNCQLFTEGLDLPSASCVQLVTSTASLSRYLQWCGRGLRISPKTGKRNLVIIDHGGNSRMHGEVDVDRDWYNGGRSLGALMTACRKCGSVVEVWRDICPACSKSPAQFRGTSALARRRIEQQKSYSTATRPCPEWASSVQSVWWQAEIDRQKNGYPLSYSESRCRKAMRARR